MAEEKTKPDPTPEETAKEIEAIGNVLRSLNEFDQKARVRILTYAAQYFDAAYEVTNELEPHRFT